VPWQAFPWGLRAAWQCADEFWIMFGQKVKPSKIKNMYSNLRRNKPVAVLAEWVPAGWTDYICIN
jgi:type IV secretory pathway VirB4 component